MRKPLNSSRILRRVSRKLETLLDVGLRLHQVGAKLNHIVRAEKANESKLPANSANINPDTQSTCLDEPTTGLHFDDTKRLIKVLNRLVDNGNTVYIIEHNLDVIKSCDYLIDLGPEGGAAGGELLAKGTPEEVSKNSNSYTGLFLQKILNLKPEEHVLAVKPPAMIQIASPSDFKSSDIPTDPGVYLYRDEQGEIIYVGKAKSLRSRVKSYFSKQRPPS